MKCPICNGKGYVYNALGSFNEDCGHCQGTGKVRVEGEPLTNEEWFCQLSTEEKAEFSMRVFCNCSWCLDGGSPKECPFNEFLNCPAESKENMMKWLKEMHI